MSASFVARIVTRCLRCCFALLRERPILTRAVGLRAFTDDRPVSIERRIIFPSRHGGMACVAISQRRPVRIAGTSFRRHQRAIRLGYPAQNRFSDGLATTPGEGTAWRTPRTCSLPAPHGSKGGSEKSANTIATTQRRCPSRG